jgi:PIN domain nuclease of toxin-antitoxin system
VFELLPIRPDHLNALLDLPLHHRDPFNRMLIGQAMVEDATLVSADATLDRYDLPPLW